MYTVTERWVIRLIVSGVKNFFEVDCESTKRKSIYAIVFYADTRTWGGAFSSNAFHMMSAVMRI